MLFSYLVHFFLPLPMYTITTTQSRKQGPSHRKVRRWRNEQFDDLAFEVEASSTSSTNNNDNRGGRLAAEALRKAKEKAHLYKDIVNFNDRESEPLSR